MPTVNDVTQLNPIDVYAIATPHCTSDVQRAFRESRLPVSIGGGHFSMGGHTASPDTLHLDLRRMNRVLSFDPQARTIQVEAGIRWCDIQRFIDPHGLAVKIMQTYANFTVGGALSVNAHGRYMGLGPVVLSVRSIRLVLPDGEAVDCGPQQRPDLFYAAIGGYGAIGVITEATLDLAQNTRVERHTKTLSAAEYPAWFDANVRGRQGAVFHNCDLYPPHYARGRAVTWFDTPRRASDGRLQPLRELYLPEKYFMWAVTESPFGQWRREHLLEPLLYLRKKVHWRNYEAGYDVAELEPVDRSARTYVLQEYFVPHDRFGEFVPRMAAVLARHGVNAVNVSVRHASRDPGTVLAWARGETFAFVLYYKQRTHDKARGRVAIWTRELIDAALACGGTYYLPYQLHATQDQFERAYPGARTLFELKRTLDPDYRLRGALWDKYYAKPKTRTTMADARSLFHSIYDDDRESDRFFTFLQNIFNLFPEDRLHALIREETRRHAGDEAIYRAVQGRLPSITPPLAMLTHALPSLSKQKAEIGRQTAQLLGDRVPPSGYIEIGSTGRYVRAVQKHARVGGPVTLVNDKPPGFSPTDIVERGGLLKLGGYVDLNNYAPIAVPPQSAELVSAFIGLHHMAPEKLEPFLKSIAAALKPGGVFIVRDHDVKEPLMDDFVALAHTVFNAGLGESWEANQAELRHFASADVWVQRIEAAGFRHMGPRLLQAGDPSDNLLMAFERTA